MIELRGVTKRFGEVAAVQNVDLRIEPGEFLTLLGPSGCGKTTLLRIISGFETPDCGTVLLDNRDVTLVPPYRRDVNQVFQSYALFPHLSVAENVAFGLRMKRIGRSERMSRLREAIELVSLAGLERRHPGQLSGGQKQRVALARALVCRPSVLLLDEPLAALDAKLRRAMQIELKRLQVRVGITFVFVTHDQEEALVMSDRIAVMNNGRIEQLGPASQIYRQPASAFVADFLGQANVLQARFAEECPGVVVAGSLRLQVTCEALPQGGVGFVSIRPERIRVAKTLPPGPNTFRATVRERIFRGATDQVLLETDSGRCVTALLGNERPAASLVAGDEVLWHVDPEDVTILPSC